MLFLGAVAVWFALAAPTHAQSNTALIRFDPETLQVGAGQVEELNVVIDNANAIYGIDLRLQFDPSAVELVDADESQDGVQVGPGPFIKPDFAVRNMVDNSGGMVEYVVTQVSPTPPATGSGVVLKLLVRAKKQGASSLFHVSKVEVANGKGVKLPIEPQDGKVEGVAPKPETSIPPLEKTAEPTGTRAATRAAAAATRARATSLPVEIVSSDNTGTLTNIILGVIAVGGCLVALLVLGIGAFLLLRKPRADPPQFPRG